MIQLYKIILIVFIIVCFSGCSEEKTYDIPLTPTLRSDFSLALKFESASNNKMEDIFELALGATCGNRLDVFGVEQLSYPKTELHVGIVAFENVLNDHYLSTESSKGMKEVFADIIKNHFVANITYRNTEKLVYEGNIEGRTEQNAPLVIGFEETDISWISEARNEIIGRLEQYNVEFGTNYVLNTDTNEQNFVPHVTILHTDTMRNSRFSNDERDDFITNFWNCGITNETKELTLRIPDWEFYE